MVKCSFCENESWIYVNIKTKKDGKYSGAQFTIHFCENCDKDLVHIDWYSIIDYCFEVQGKTTREGLLEYTKKKSLGVSA